MPELILDISMSLDGFVAGPNPTLEDPVTIQSGESRLIVERGRISRIGTTATAAPGV